MSETSSAHLPGIAGRTLVVKRAHDGDVVMDIVLTELPGHPYLTRIIFRAQETPFCTLEALYRLIRALSGPPENWVASTSFHPKTLTERANGSEPDTWMLLDAQDEEGYHATLTIHGKNAYDQPAQDWVSFAYLKRLHFSLLHTLAIAMQRDSSPPVPSVHP